MLECIWLEFRHPNSKPFLIAIMYQPGNNTIWRDSLAHTLDMADNKHKEIIILGDLLINTNFQDKRSYQPIHILTSQYQLKQLIDAVTIGQYQEKQSTLSLPLWRIISLNVQVC